MVLVVLSVLTSPSSSASLHRAGSLDGLNPDQHGGSSISHSDPELPSLQNRDLIVSNIALRELRNSAQTSPRDGPSPSTCPTVLLRRTITYDTLLFPDDTRQGISIPRKRTNPEEGPWGSSWGSLRSRPSFDDRQCLAGTSDPTLPLFLSDTPDNIHVHLDDQRGIRGMRSRRSVRSVSVQSIDPEQIAMRWETEGQRREADAAAKEDGALLLEKARQPLVEAKRLEVDARHAEASAKMREAAAQKKEAEAKRKEAEAKKWEAEAQRKLEEARQKELEAHRKEEEAKRNEEQASKREEEARLEEAVARRREDDAQRWLEDAQQQEILARQMEEDVRLFEEKVRKEEEEHEDLRVRPAQKTVTRQALGIFRNERKEAIAKDSAQLEATKGDAANRSAEEVKGAPPGQNKQPAVQDRARAKRQRDEGLEESRQKELEEQQRLEKERFSEEKRRKERKREEQIRLDEELSRQEQARLDREAILAVLGQERLKVMAQEKEAHRLQEDHRRIGEGRYKLLEEQRRKVVEQSHPRDRPRWQQQQHQDEILRQRARGQQQKVDLSVLHPPAGPGPMTADGGSRGAIRKPSVRSTASSGSSHTGVSSTTDCSTPSYMAPTTPKPLPASARPAPGAWRIPYTTSNLAKEDPARRAAREEHVIQQQEQFKREQERVESERQANLKISKEFPKKSSIEYTKTRSHGNSSKAAAPWLDYFRAAVRPSQRRG